MSTDATIMRYEPCAECTDGTCRACGQASGEHAAPGVRLIVRRIRFIACVCKGRGCANCGPAAHPLAAKGVTTEIIEERATKRWVPSVHLKTAEGKSVCGSWAPEERMSDNRSGTTCQRCLKFAKRK